MAENYALPQTVKTCPDLATNYGGRFPFIALMSRHIERSYIHHPRPSSTLLPCPEHTIADSSSTFTSPLPFSDLAVESFAELSTSGSSALHSIHLPATQPQPMNREAHISARSRLVATTWVTQLHPIRKLARLHQIQRLVLAQSLVGAASAGGPLAPPYPTAVAPPLRAGLRLPPAAPSVQCYPSP